MSEKIPQWAQQRIDEVREKGLTELRLSGHGKNEKLTAVPDVITKLTNLRVLDLSDNQLTSLPDTFLRLTNLEYLDLNDNQLTVVPAWLEQLPKLKHLHLNSNPASATSSLSQQARDIKSQINDLSSLRFQMKEVLSVEDVKDICVNFRPIHDGDTYAHPT